MSHTMRKTLHHNFGINFIHLQKEEIKLVNCQTFLKSIFKVIAFTR